jgi:DNA-directed RNA polymerase
MNELDRSLERLLRSEKHRTRLTGFGTTKQGQALTRKYREQLADKIGAERAHGRNKPLWRALKGIDNETLALRLLVAGISVSEEGSNLGTDEDGEKNFRDMALWIGLNFSQRGEPGLRVGAWGIDMLKDLPAFGLDGEILKLTATADELMDEVLAQGIKNNALLHPLDTPAQDWTQVRKGGLPAGHWAIEPLIRERHPSIEAAVRNAISRRRMQRVLDAINALQRTPFTINEPVLDFIRASEPTTAQPQVSDTDIVIAEAMACTADRRFWVPLNIDFRGRIYGIPHFNFAREDHVRGLFLFANGEPIGEDGIGWLKAYVAATAGGNAWSPVEKPGELNFGARIAWTETNLPTLRRIGEAVLRGDDPATIAWALPNDRYQFLAACVELVQALNAGPDFITRLPLMFDATSSGLQHLCAMTRAEEGRYANLVAATQDGFDWVDDDGTVMHERAADEAHDFYRRLAHRVWKEGTASWSHWGLFPLSDFIGPFDREIVKQPGMSYFYGSRPGGFAKSKDGRWHSFGMTKQIIAALKKKNRSTKGAKQLAHAIYDVIEDMVPRAKAVRDFLEELAKLCAANGKSLRWTTPLDLPVINAYHEAETKRIAVPLNGRRRKVKLVVGDKDDIDEEKAANAVTANFVHSADACHLQLVALAAAREGIEMATVHDCFGCVAPHAERLKEIIPEQFVHLHKRHNLLNEVRESARRDLPKHVELPPLPETGNLEIEDVLKSFHAFR